jgi:TctA family transporter
MLVILNLPLIGMWVRLLAMPYRLMFPAILLFSAIGTYSLNNNTFDVFMAAGFGLLGWAFTTLDCPPAPLLLGSILGPMMEENLRRTLLISGGDPTVFVRRPISLGLLVATVVIVVLLALPSLRSKREEAFQEET